MNTKKRKWNFDRAKLQEIAQTRNVTVDNLLLSAGLTVTQIVQINRNSVTLPMLVGLKEIGIEDPFSCLKENLNPKPETVVIVKENPNETSPL